ncbi:MAG: MFS transporter [Coriobacteriales bacterium]|jgi:MFS family permease|nr:MFS transporter [Coriobacteriales bacterium]
MDVEYPRFRWYFALVYFLCYTVNGVCMIAPSVIMQPISESLGISLGEASMALILTYTGGGIVGGIIGGAIADRFNLPSVYLVCCALSAVGLVATWMADTSVALAVAGRLVSGIAGGTPGTLGSKMVAQWFPERQRAVVLGVGAGCLALGTTIGLLAVSPLFAATLDWNVAVSAVGLPWIALVLMCLPLFRGKPPAMSAMLDEQNTPAASELFKRSVRLPVFFIMLLSLWCASWCMNVYNDLTPGNIAVDAPMGLGYGYIIAGQVMSLYSLSFMVGSFLSGAVVHAVFKDRLRPFCVIFFLVAAVFDGAVLVPFVYDSLTVMRVCLVIGGLSLGLVIPTIPMFIALSFPEQVQGRIAGITMGLGFTGGTIGLAVSSALLHFSGNYKLSITTCIVICVVGSLLAVWLVKPHISISEQTAGLNST